MKKHLLKIWILILIMMGLFMASQSFVSKAQTSTAPRYAGVCSDVSAYNNSSLTTSQIMDLYHENINNMFNDKIRKMIQGETDAANTGDYNKPDSIPPANEICPASNYSTYCLAQATLKDYMAYIKALDCRRSVLFENVDQQQSAPLQLQAALMVSSRMEAITNEKGDAKRALDQALAAYNELRFAWPMHKKYMKIYESLTKFRDKMVEIRQQVSEFPSKFIDATTTKCT